MLVATNGSHDLHSHVSVRVGFISYGAVVMNFRLQHVDHVADPFAPEIFKSCELISCFVLCPARLLSSRAGSTITSPRMGPWGVCLRFQMFSSYYMDCLSLFVWILVFDSNSIWHECIGPTHLLIQNDA